MAIVFFTHSHFYEVEQSVHHVVRRCDVVGNEFYRLALLQKLSESSVKNGSDIAQKKNLNTEKKEETVIKKGNSFHLKNNNE